MRVREEKYFNKARQRARQIADKVFCEKNTLSFFYFTQAHSACCSGVSNCVSGEALKGICGGSNPYVTAVKNFRNEASDPICTRIFSGKCLALQVSAPPQYFPSPSFGVHAPISKYGGSSAAWRASGRAFLPVVSEELNAFADGFHIVLPVCLVSDYEPAAVVLPVPFCG